MRELITLYFGAILLMYLSQYYYPVHQAERCGRSAGFMRTKTDVFMLVAIFWLAATMFLRTRYNDTDTYIGSWRNAPSVTSFIQNGGLTDLTGNPLSMLYQSFAHDVFRSYHTYFLFPAFLITTAVVKLFKKYSVSPAMSMVVFISIGTFVMYIAAMKQCLAMFVLLISIPYAERKQYLPFYLLVFVAILFHTHAFMFLILPLLFGKPWGKVTWLGLFAVLIMMVTYDVTLGAFMEYAQSIGAMVAESELFDGHQINILRVIVYWIPAIFALCFRSMLFHNSSRLENLFVNMSIVAAFILTLGTVQAANLFARMAAYFEIASAIALPWMIRKVFTKQSARFVSGIAFVCYFLYFLYEFGVSKNFGNDYAAISLWQYILELLGR